MIQAAATGAVKPVTDLVFKAGLLWFAYWLLTKGEKERKEQEEEKKKQESDARVSEGPEVGQAIALRAAMNPSGLPWLMWTDTTKVEDIMKIATEIKDLKKVIFEYGQQYPGSRLLEDLERELGPEGLKRFESIAKGTDNAYANYSTVKTGIAVNDVVRAKVNSRVRSSPKKESSTFSQGNIIAVVPTGKVIGFTTGVTSYDNENDVIFIEVRTYKDTQLYKVWVAKSNVELIPYADYKKRVASGEKFPFFSFVTLKGFTGVPRVLVRSIAPATIHSPKGVTTGNASTNTQLGTFVYRFTIGKKSTVVFRTQQGHTRLVDAEKVQLINT